MLYLVSRRVLCSLANKKGTYQNTMVSRVSNVLIHSHPPDSWVLIGTQNHSPAFTREQLAKMHFIVVSIAYQVRSTRKQIHYSWKAELPVVNACFITLQKAQSCFVNNRRMRASFACSRVKKCELSRSSVIHKLVCLASASA